MSLRKNTRFRLIWGQASSLLLTLTGDVSLRKSFQSMSSFADANSALLTSTESSLYSTKVTGYLLSAETGHINRKTTISGLPVLIARKTVINTPRNSLLYPPRPIWHIIGMNEK